MLKWCLISTFTFCDKPSEWESVQWDCDKDNDSNSGPLEKSEISLTHCTQTHFLLIHLDRNWMFLCSTNKTFFQSTFSWFGLTKFIPTRWDHMFVFLTQVCPSCPARYSHCSHHFHTGQVTPGYEEKKQERRKGKGWRQRATICPAQKLISNCWRGASVHHNRDLSKGVCLKSGHQYQFKYCQIGVILTFAWILWGRIIGNLELFVSAPFLSPWNTSFPKLHFDSTHQETKTKRWKNFHF